MTIRNAAVLTLATLLPSMHAEARSGQGTMGSQSRAAVSISVSVAPSFNVAASGEDNPAEALAASSNVARLRVALVSQPLDQELSFPEQAALDGLHHSGARQVGRNAGVLVLIVPD